MNTKHGNVNTDHILFVASGAFHQVQPCTLCPAPCTLTNPHPRQAKPSDLLAELQGRMPIRVELKALTEKDM